jgi:2-phosphosulfolactate phosphatase
MDDFAAAAYMAYRDNRGNLLDYVKMAGHYNYLLSIGLEEDIKYCFTEDIINIVPEYRNGKIVVSTK